ncbi:MAG: AMP-binding protein [Leptospirales bacterium]|jgi:phenylacetate-CoA ligase
MSEDQAAKRKAGASTAIPEEIRARIPLMRPEWLPNFLRLIEHERAPRWNTRCGDRLEKDDLPRIDAFARMLTEFHNAQTQESTRFEAASEDRRAAPPAKILRWLREQARDSLAIRARLRETTDEIRAAQGRDLDLARDFPRLRPMTRADFARRLETIVPQTIDLDRLIVNPTSGTTGQPILAPNHPVAVACYDSLIQAALKLNGLTPDYARSDGVAAVQICAQRRTITYATVHAALNGAGFAKINLAASEWRSDWDARDYIASLAPFFLSGDPYSFSVLLDYLQRMAAINGANDGDGEKTTTTALFGESGYRPRALISTALRLSPGLRAKLETAFACPVVDLYSLNETGPIACSVPGAGERMAQLTPDIYIEAIDPNTGAPVPDGDVGEIAVTGGRNPYLPLLRYVTGDRGRVFRRTDGSAQLELLHSRDLVLFEYAGQDPGRRLAAINPIDIARVLRAFPIVQFQFAQFKNRDCLLTLQISGKPPLRHENQIRAQLDELFGFAADAGLRIDYTEDWSPARYGRNGGGDATRKVAPFLRETGAGREDA